MTRAIHFSILSMTFSLVSISVNGYASSLDDLAFSQDSSQILYLSDADSKPAIHFLNSQNGKETRITQLTINPQQQRVMGFTPDGFKLAVLEQVGLSILHNQTGKTLRTLPVPALPTPVTQYRPTEAITNASGTQQLFHATHPARLHVVHTGNGKLLATITLPVAKLLGMGMSADGRTVAYLTAGKNGQGDVHLYDMYQQKVSKTLNIPIQPATFQTLTLSHDSQYLAIMPLLLNVGTGKTTPLASANSSSRAIFSANGKTLFFTAGHQLYRHEPATGQQQAINLSLPADCSHATAYDFSPNGTWLAIGYPCQKAPTITLLNAENGQWLWNIMPSLTP